MNSLLEKVPRQAALAGISEPDRIEQGEQFAQSWITTNGIGDNGVKRLDRDAPYLSHRIGPDRRVLPRRNENVGQRRRGPSGWQTPSFSVPFGGKDEAGAMKEKLDERA